MTHQSAVAATLMRTSPGPGGSTVTVVTSSGCFAAHATAALHSMGLPAVACARGWDVVGGVGGGG